MRFTRMDSASAPAVPIRFDHPFLFFVRDLETGAVLFIGQVTDPSVANGG